MAKLISLLLVILFLAVPSPARNGAEASAVPQAAIPASYTAVAENEHFRLYVDADTLAFKLLDRRSGYLWHSGLDELAPGDRLNKAWQAFAKSGISIEYLDAKTINKRISVANANHTLAVTPIEQGVSAQLTFTDFGITLGMNLQLEANGVRVEVPFSSIREENPAFRLGLLYLYPFLGATRGGSMAGYMFLPDGTGSLIRFADTTKAKNMYYGRYYGPDLGMVATLPFDPQINRPYPISFPVFGMVHGEGQNAFLAITEKGAAYGELQAHPAGIITNFNFIYNVFIYNQSYFQATNRSGAGVTTLQRQPNAFDVVMHYRFLTGEAADYVGMARSYQRYLAERGLLKKLPIANPDIGMRLEFLGGDKEKVLLWHRFVPMTTFRQAEEILADLQVANPEVIFYGWQPLGASSMPPTALRVEGDLGSLADLRRLAESCKVKANSTCFSLYLDPQAALRDEPGYSPRNDLALAITNVNLEGYNRNKINAYFTAPALQRRYLALARDVPAKLDAGLALDGIGWTLYSDFRSDRPLNREQAIGAYRELLAQSPVPPGFYRPNDYLWGLARAYYDMPLGDNGYTYTSEAVPFLPIVLAGYLPYYGPALNFSSNPQEDLLRHADYGIYPSYFLTHEATARMLNTRSNWIYTSSYAQWGDQIRATYQWLNELLRPVRGEEIISRRKLAEGVFATGYANGKTIVVNYTDRPFAHDGRELAARSAALWEAAP
ncbi:MAG: DUF5696 domain-containing protein [Anaerolineae bacterium]